MKRFWISILVFTLVISAAGCRSSGEDFGSSRNLMEDIQPVDMVICPAEERDYSGYLDFSVALLQKTQSADNTLVSPLSVYSALAMTANGAKGETLAQMETVMGMPLGELNAWHHSLLAEEQEKLKTANAIWFTDDERFTVNPDFLQTNADYYRAGIYSAPFDESTRQDINRWVEDHTDGMIPEVLDRISPDAVMYLVNALAFEAKWETVYTPNQLRERNFYREDGTDCRVEFMHSMEGCYLENELATGFMKYYEGGDYAFAALLPKEGLTMGEFVDALDGEMLKKLLDSVEYTMVDAAMPGFEAEYGVEMAEVLKALGMELAFDPENADFSGLGTSGMGNISISRVIHKTFISVDANGTRAAAATVVEPTDGAAMVEPEIKSVLLDRPFLYMIVDLDSGIPIFIGTMTDPGAR